jgi:hypothetical protein
MFLMRNILFFKFIAVAVDFFIVFQFRSFRFKSNQVLPEAFFVKIFQRLSSSHFFQEFFSIVSGTFLLRRS